MTREESRLSRERARLKSKKSTRQESVVKIFGGNCFLAGEMYAYVACGVAGGRGRGDRRREAEYDAIMMCSPLVMITAEPDYRLIIPTVIFFDN